MCSSHSIQKAEAVLVETGLQACNTCCPFPVSAQSIGSAAVAAEPTLLLLPGGRRIKVHAFSTQLSYFGPLLLLCIQAAWLLSTGESRHSYDSPPLTIHGSCFLQEAVDPLALAQSEARLLQRGLEGLQDKWEKTKVGVPQPPDVITVVLVVDQYAWACYPSMNGFDSHANLLSMLPRSQSNTSKGGNGGPCRSTMLQFFK